jgi:hypothetical protein
VDLHRRAQRRDDRREVVRRIVRADVAADRAAVSHLHVRDLGRHLGQDRARLRDLARPDQLGERHHRAELQASVPAAADRAQLLEPVEVDEDVGSGGPGLHHVRQRLPAGERASPVVGPQQANSVVDARRARVLDLGEEHGEDSTLRPAALSRRKAQAAISRSRPARFAA